jgi:hypothetical protein
VIAWQPLIGILRASCLLPRENPGWRRQGPPAPIQAKWAGLDAAVKVKAESP